MQSTGLPHAWLLPHLHPLARMPAGDYVDPSQKPSHTRPAASGRSLTPGSSRLRLADQLLIHKLPAGHSCRHVPGWVSLPLFWTEAPMLLASGPCSLPDSPPSSAVVRFIWCGVPALGTLHGPPPLPLSIFVSSQVEVFALVCLCSICSTPLSVLPHLLVQSLLIHQAFPTCYLLH